MYQDWSQPTHKSCPRCSYPLVHEPQSSVDHCHRCGGTLVDTRAIDSYTGPWANPSIWREKLGHATIGQKLQCGNCPGQMTGFQVPFGGRSVVVDHCDTCGSLWLDVGEGEKLSSIVQAADQAGTFSAPSSSWTAPVDEDLAYQQTHTAPPGVGTYVFQVFTGMPIEVWNPVRNVPYVTRGLVVGLVFIFALQLMYMLPMPDEATKLEFLKQIGLSPEHVLRGERIWGLLSYMLLHGGVYHLVSNLYFLWLFGDNVEDRLGPANFLVLFVTAGFLGGVLEVIFTGNPGIPVVGASGSIAGLMAAYMVLFPKIRLWVVWFFVRWRVPVFVYLGFWIVLQIVGMSFGVGQVAWMAHIGGFLAGLGLGALYRSSQP